jgi:hypothetical protein
MKADWKAQQCSLLEFLLGDGAHAGWLEKHGYQPRGSFPAEPISCHRSRSVENEAEAKLQRVVLWPLAVRQISKVVEAPVPIVPRAKPGCLPPGPMQQT